MTTPRIEEIKEATPKHYAKSSTLPKQIVVTYPDFMKALTQARQAGIDETMDRIQKEVFETPASYEEENAGSKEGDIWIAEMFYNRFKALQDNK